MKKRLLILVIIISSANLTLFAGTGNIPDEGKISSVQSPIDTFFNNQSESFNSLYVEILGNGGSFSINYERMIFKNFNVRLGTGILLSTSSSNTGKHTDVGADIFLMPNYLINIYRSNFIEAGAGVLYQGTKLLGTFSFGYGYRPKTGGFLFRLTFDTRPNPENKFMPWLGLGIGIQF